MTMAQWYKALVLIVLVVSTSLYFIIYNLSIEFKLMPSERTMYNEKETLFPYTNLSLIEKVVKSNKSHDDVANQDFAVKENVEIMEKSCTPTKKLIFSKTHKTGGTTVQNIIFRFGEKNRLMFVLPKSKYHVFDLGTHFKAEMADLYTQENTVE